ncbi:glycosyltransferase [Aeromonas veronii]|uniref:glycosyltransferase n=1 Tax=Aeromonas veronii TaxID=654 RepID=UPI003BA3A22F
MKILVFNTLYYPNRRGGAERSVQLICENMAAKGHTVEVVSIWDEMSPQLEIHNEVKCIKWKSYNIYSVHNYGIKKPRWLSKVIWQILDLFNFAILFKAYFYIRKTKPDVIWCNNLSGFSISVWVASKLLDVRVVHTFRDYYLLSNNVMLYKCGPVKPGENIISRAKLFIFKFLSPCVDTFIGISDSISAKHKVYIDNHNVYTVFNSEDYRNDEYESEHVRRKKTYLTYGYLGQINEAKGVSQLIENFLSFSKKSRLLIAGKDEEDISSKFKNNERIEFIGFVDKKCFFEKIDCLLVPSLWEEPFGRVVIEALCMKTPVVVSGNGGLSELSDLFASVSKHDFIKEYDYDKTNIVFDEGDIDIIVNNFSVDKIASEYIGFMDPTLIVEK